MTRSLDLTAVARTLADAAALAVRLLTGRSPQPVHAAIHLRATPDALILSATDGTLSAQLIVPALVHEPGEALVSRRGLAETLSALDVPEARLVCESGRLAVRVPGGRFALPVLPDAWAQPAAPPLEVGRVDGRDLRRAAAAVAGAASREHALPIFTGVRLRAAADRLSMLATDRYRLAVADLSFTSAPGAAPFEALVPAMLLSRVAPALGRAESVGLHVTGDQFALSWAGALVSGPTLGAAYPDAQFDRLLEIAPECTVEVESDALAAAVDRAGSYAGQHGRVTLQSIEGALLVRAADPLRGESEETVKAVIHAGRMTRSYQGRLLLDALRNFPDGPVRLRVQAGLRATEVTGADAGLRYLIVPMRTDEE